MSIRQLMQEKPWVGWTLVGVLLLASVLLYLRLRPAPALDGKYMVENLTITCTETGKQWQMRRGEMEKILRGRGFQVDPTQGLPNPDTGKLTGFPPKSVWEESVSRINAERRARLEQGKINPASIERAEENLPEDEEDEDR